MKSNLEQSINIDSLPVMAQTHLTTSGSPTRRDSAHHGASRKRGNIKEYQPTIGDADSDTDTLTRQELVARSRDLYRNAPIARGAIDTNKVHVVGSGLAMQSRIDHKVLGLNPEEASAWQGDTERKFRSWANNLDCDFNRGLSFSGYQKLVLTSTLETGDSFILFPIKKLPNQKYRTRLQIIEGDRISNPNDSVDTAGITQGVQKISDGTPHGYHIRTTHPGANQSIKPERKWGFVKAFNPQGGRNILHVFEKLRPGQTRGIPYLSVVIEILKQLSRYTDASLQDAVISSYFTVFITTESGQSFRQFEDTDGNGAAITDDPINTMSSGAQIPLFPGEKVEFADPGRPNQNFDHFVQAIIRQIGVALGLPFELLVQHFTKSYSAARAAMLMAWKMFLTRRAWLVEYFCDPVYEVWMREAIMIGDVEAPGFDDPVLRDAWLANEWVGPVQGQIDPLREAKADREIIEMGLNTKSGVAKGRGLDYEKNATQRILEAEEGAMLNKKRGTSTAVSVPNPEDDKPSEDDEN